MKHSLASLAALSLASVIAGHAQDSHNSTAIRLAKSGENCGDASQQRAVCGDGLCCSIHTETCGTGGSFCGASICLPAFSTGCMYQGILDAALGRDEKDRGEDGGSSEQPIIEEATMAETSLQEPVREEVTVELSSTEERPTEEFDTKVPMPEEGVAEQGGFVPGPFPSLDSLRRLPRPQLGAVPYGRVITSCKHPGSLALTFDDGPWHYTSNLLDLLDDYEVHATFFVCGGNLAPDQLTSGGRPDVIRRMIAAGHQVGTHTWGHPHMREIDSSEAFRQMLLNEQALVGVLGMIPTYFRPPYLEYKQETLDVVRELGYHVMTLDVDTRDWEGDYDAARQNFLDALDSGGDSKLVLAHDTHEETVSDFAEWMIETATDRGFELVTVGECLGDSMNNWYRNPYDGGSWRSNGEGSADAPNASSAHQHARRAMQPQQVLTADRASWPPIEPPIEPVAHGDSAGAAQACEDGWGWVSSSPWTLPLRIISIPLWIVPYLIHVFVADCRSMGFLYALGNLVLYVGPCVFWLYLWRGMLGVVAFVEREEAWRYTLILEKQTRLLEEEIRLLEEGRGGHMEGEEKGVGAEESGLLAEKARLLDVTRGLLRNANTFLSRQHPRFLEERAASVEEDGGREKTARGNP